MLSVYKTNDKDLSFWEHVSELVTRLRRMFFSIIVCTIFVMTFPVKLNLEAIFSDAQYVTVTTYVIRKMQEDFLPPEVELMPVGWFAPLEVYFYVSLMLGVLLSLPVIAYELYKFINPALYEHEKRLLWWFAVSFVFLFTLGFLIGYVLVIPLTLRTLLLLIEPLGLIPRYELTSFFSLVVGGLLVSGLVFTFPTYFILLVKAGVLSTQHITRNRKYIYPGIIIFISFIDPDPTLITELFIGIPIIILMEISVLIARRFEKQFH
jgi:sec-independent protein translocase protein TatC